MEQNPRASLLRLSAQSGVPLSTCQKIVNKKLNLHPHKVSLVQELKPADYSRRVAYYNWFLNNMNDKFWNCHSFQTRHGFIFQGTLIHRTVEFGVQKILMSSKKHLCMS
jgi:hypothetical protein